MTLAIEPTERVRVLGARALDRSTGTELAPVEDYEPGACVPRGPWTPLSPDALAPPIDAVWDPGRMIALIELPPAVTAVVRRLGISRLTLGAAQRRLAAPGVNFMLDDALTSIAPFAGGRPFQTLGWFAQRTTTPTFTVNTENGKKTGLHVDSWERRPLAKRHHSGNRLCMNLGTTPRYFLFVDATLRGISDVLGRLALDPGRALGQRFLTDYPDHPIIRLLVPPGCAYIAPTENILHDGAPSDPNAIDVTCQLLGEFHPVEVSSSPS